MKTLSSTLALPASQASKMEARFAALEQRLLKDQEDKHAALVDLLAKLQHPEQAGEVTCKFGLFFTLPSLSWANFVALWKNG